jgi:hypothetical protein
MTILLIAMLPIAFIVTAWIFHKEVDLQTHRILEELAKSAVALVLVLVVGRLNREKEAQDRRRKVLAFKGILHDRLKAALPWLRKILNAEPPIFAIVPTSMLLNNSRNYEFFKKHVTQVHEEIEEIKNLMFSSDVEVAARFREEQSHLLDFLVSVRSYLDSPSDKTYRKLILGSENLSGFIGELS